ncbi:hypothetical protein BD414DRAFT_517043 [Trametes punicea]|nr:hypothetical protein BD414DRAFT_517043 [Trametes punicea]
MSASQRTSRSPGGAAPSQGEFDPAKAGGAPRPQASASSSSMIGQIPSLFDPNMAIPPESGLDYQQWVENYANGQYTYPQQQGALSGNVPQVPFQHAQPQSQLHHVQTSPSAPPTQNRYNFVQEQQYAPAGEQGTSFDTHFRGMPRISRQGGATVGYPSAPNLRIPEPPRSPHHQQQAFGVQGAAQGGESADVISAPSDQAHHHSSYNFVQQYQPEPYSATSYTPSSDFTNLPSSVSTPSVGGTDESHAFSSASSHLSQQAPQQPQASSSRQPAGPAARNRGGRGGRQGQKRQRIDDQQDGGDSDTQSDDDHVNVPPPQGQNSLPTRL